MFGKKKEELAKETAAERTESEAAKDAGAAKPEPGETVKSSAAAEGAATPAADGDGSVPAGEAEQTQAAQASEGSAGEAKAAPSPTPSEPDWKQLYALTLADFDNYKKRAVRDREDSYRYAEADILKDVLPAVDNLKLALASAKEKADDPFVKGVKLVFDTLLKSLKDHGAEPFDSVGEVLDTERMEAIATLPSETIEEGKVSIESKQGWMLRGKVLRAAQVVVSSGKPDGAK